MGEEQHLMSAIELDPETTTQTLPLTEPSYLEKLAFPSKTSTLNTTKQILHFLLPSFLHFTSASSSEPINERLPKPVHPTAWLDGMRGIAALLVYVYHLSYSTHDVDTAWTYDGKQDFLRLPLIRFFYNGHFMVAIFFVLSGYALSYKPVKQIRNQETQPLLEGLASSVFRRWMRLFLPCFVSTTAIVVLLRLGMYDWTREIADDQARLPFHRERHAGRYETLGKQIWAWTTAFFAFANPFTARDMPIDPHLWTISIEYGASIVLYATQLGLCRLRTRYRILSLLCLVFMAHQADRWPNILFFGGFVLAELDHRRRALATPSISNSPFSSSKRFDVFWSITYICIFICGLYLGGQPELAVDKAPGWITLHSLIPKHIRDKHRYWVNWAAILLIWSTSNSSLLQKIFTNRHDVDPDDRDHVPSAQDRYAGEPDSLDLFTFNPGSWELAADMLHPYYAISSHTQSIAGSLPSSMLPRISFSISVNPEFSSDSAVPSPIELFITSRAPLPITLNANDTIFDTTEWNSYLRIAHIGSSVGLPRNMAAWRSSRVWSLRRDLLDHGFTKRVPDTGEERPPHLVTLHPGVPLQLPVQRPLPADPFAELRPDENQHDRRLLDDHEAGGEAHLDLSRNSWRSFTVLTWGTADNLKGPYGLPALRIEFPRSSVIARRFGVAIAQHNPEQKLFLVKAYDCKICKIGFGIQLLSSTDLGRAVSSESKDWASGAGVHCARTATRVGVRKTVDLYAESGA
ncbi:hypothetical protein KCU61_g7821, partial [Aureobasidium melanogenum]